MELAEDRPTTRHRNGIAYAIAGLLIDKRLLSRCSRQDSEEDEAQLKQQRDLPAHIGLVESIRDRCCSCCCFSFEATRTSNNHFPTICTLCQFPNNRFSSSLAFYHECRHLYRSLFSEFNRRKFLPVCLWKAGRRLPLDSMSWQRRDSPSCDCFDHLRNSHLQQNLRCGLRSIRSSPPAFDLDG